MASSKKNFSLLWHSLIASQQKASIFGNDKKTWWISGKGCNQVTLDSILQTAFGFAVQVIHLVDSCSPLRQVWQVQSISRDKTGQEKQSRAGHEYMHTACVGSWHTLLPSTCHMHSLQEMGVSCLLFLFPLDVRGEAKGAAILQCQLSLIHAIGQHYSAQETELFHKSRLRRQSRKSSVWKGPSRWNSESAVPDSQHKRYLEKRASGRAEISRLKWLRGKVWRVKRNPEAQTQVTGCLAGSDFAGVGTSAHLQK